MEGFRQSPHPSFPVPRPSQTGTSSVKVEPHRSTETSVLNLPPGINFFADPQIVLVPSVKLITSVCLIGKAKLVPVTFLPIF